MPINVISSKLPVSTPHAIAGCLRPAVPLSSYLNNLKHTPIKITYCIFTGTWHFQLEPTDDKTSLPPIRSECSVSLPQLAHSKAAQREREKKIAQWRRMICRLTILVEVDVMPLSCAPGSILFYGYRVPETCIRYTCIITRTKKNAVVFLRYFSSLFFASEHWHGVNVFVCARVQWLLKPEEVRLSSVSSIYNFRQWTLFHGASEENPSSNTHAIRTHSDDAFCWAGVSTTTDLLAILFCFQSFRSWICLARCFIILFICDAEKTKYDPLTELTHRLYTIFAMCQCRRSYVALSSAEPFGRRGERPRCCAWVSFAFKSHSPKIYVIWIDTSSKFAFCCRRHCDVGGVFDKAVFYSTRVRARNKSKIKSLKENSSSGSRTMARNKEEWKEREEKKNGIFFSWIHFFIFFSLSVLLSLCAARFFIRVTFRVE